MTDSSEREPIVSATTRDRHADRLFARAASSTTFPREGRGLLIQAVERDPDFAEAHALLAQYWAYAYFNTEPVERSRQKARHHLARAMALAPERPIVRLAECYVVGLTDDPARAAELYQRLVDEPFLAVDAWVGLGVARTSLGAYDQAADSFLEALGVLEGTDSKTRSDVDHRRAEAAITAKLADLYRAQRRHGEAERWWKRASASGPDDREILAGRTMNRLVSQSGLPPGERALEVRAMLGSSPIRGSSLPYQVRLMSDLFDAEGADPAVARAFYERIVRRIEAEPDRPGGPGGGSFFFWSEAFAYAQLGRVDDARALVEASDRELGREAESGSGVAGNVLARWAIARAYLGDHAQAKRLADEAVRSNRKDPFHGSVTREYRARVLVLTGDLEEATSELRSLLELSYSDAITQAEVEYDSVWSPVRAHVVDHR